MKPRKFMSYNLAVRDRVIRQLPNIFDSHQLLKIFKKEFENHYVTFLTRYEKGKHRKVNAQIAIGLAVNMDFFGIRKNGKVASENVFGNISNNEEWVKI